VTISPAFIVLTPALSSLNLPTAVVSGAATPAIAKILLTNSGNVASKGLVTISLSASQQMDVAGTPVTSVTRRLSIPVGKGQTVSVPLKNIPALPEGGYFFVADVSDPNGDITEVSTGFPKTIAPAFVSLSASFAEIPVPVPTTGESVTITDNGNIPETTTLTATVALSSDPAGEDLISSAAGILLPARVHLVPSKPLKIRLAGWQSLISALPAQTPYFLTFVIADSAGNGAAGVSQAFST
jgi:hypothetical protein